MLCEWKGDIVSKNKKSQQKIPLTHHRLWRGNSRLSRRFAWYSRSPCGTCWDWASLGSTYGLLHSCLQVGKVKDQSIPKGKSSQIVFTIGVVCYLCLHHFLHPATPTSKTGSGSGAFGRVAKTTSPASPQKCFSKWYFYIKTLQGSLLSSLSLSFFPSWGSTWGCTLARRRLPVLLVEPTSAPEPRWEITSKVIGSMLFANISLSILIKSTIGTEGALRLPTTYDNQFNPNPISPSQSL